MTATQQFIEDAIAGGWKAFEWQEDPRVAAVNLGDAHFVNKGGARAITFRVADILLAPLAWQAVGKTRAATWDAENTWGTVDTPQYGRCVPGWPWRWHRFIDHLADGLTIEEALAAIQQ